VCLSGTGQACRSRSRHRPARRCGNNDLIGNGGNDVLIGLGGSDGMFGGSGDDTYYVDDEGDVVGEVAGDGIDTVHASIPTYTLAEPLEVLYLEPGATSGVGNSADNTLVGNAVGNYLLSEGGNDTLNGLVGADVLVGGAGVDVFLFNRGEAHGDTVTDFAGDAIGFIGYGQGSFVRLDDTH
jgi:Ca2+-binding RTX toxin-like protein